MKRSDCRKMQGPRQAARAPGRRGSAIVIVTSLIAIMFVACVGFTIMMRTERGASANYRHMVGARQMLYAGLAQAISDINCTMATNPPAITNVLWYPPWYGQTNAMWSYATNRMHPGNLNSPINTAGVIYSLDPTTNNGTPAHVLSAEAMQYVPKSLQASVETAAPEWIIVSNSAGTAVVGRYAYIALDVSGLMDANYAGGSPRASGASPSELQVTNASSPVVDVTADATGNLATDRAAAGRFESLPDLAANATHIKPNALCNFETFSYAPSELDPEGSNKLCIASFTPANLQSLSAIDPFSGLIVTNRLSWILNKYFFSMCGFQSLDYVNRFIASLIDFTSSTSNYPAGFGYPKVKPTPMIQSVYWVPAYSYSCYGASGLYPPSDTNFYIVGVFSNINLFLVGVYCPNPNDALSTHFNSSTYQANGQITVSGYPPFATSSFYSGIKNGIQGALKTIPTGVIASNITFSPMPIPSYSTPGFVFLSGMTPLTTWAFTNCTSTNSPHYSSTLPVTTNNHLASFANQPFTNSAYVRVCITNKNLSHAIDQVPSNWAATGVQVDFTNAPYNTSYINFNSLLLFSLAPSNLCAYWSEVLDPRFNWDTTGSYFGVPQWVSENKQRTVPSLWAQGAITVSQPALMSFQSSSSVKLANWTAAATPCEPVLMFNIFTNVNLITNNASAGGLPLLFDCMGWRTNASGNSIAYGDFTNNTVPQNLIFSRNGALQSVGDLGYIPISYWYSLRLYDHKDANTFGMVPANTNKYFSVYDWFTVNTTQPPTAPRRGLININTPSGIGDVWYAALTNMAVSDYSATPQYLTQQSLDKVVAFMEDNVTNPAPMTSISQLGTLPWYTNSLSGIFHNEYDRASVIRNAASLFTTRQQIFTIIVRAEGFASTFGYTDATHGHTLGSAEAVFQIWRDPKPDANGNHPCFIRLYKILSQ